MDSQPDIDLSEQARKIKMNFRLVASLAAGIIAVGTIFYHYVEHFKWLDSFYFSVITLATVGYGDLVPHTDIGKLFTTGYVLVGIGIFATFANLLLKNSAIRREQKRHHSNNRQ